MVKPYPGIIIFLQGDIPLKNGNVQQILYGREDNMTEKSIVEDFCHDFLSHLTVVDESEHWVHTKKQVHFLEKWESKNI